MGKKAGELRVDGKPALKCGARAYEPQAAQRQQVEQLAGIGVPQKQIATILGIDHKTLLKYYETELDVGSAKATASVAGKLYSRAMAGDVGSMIFWLKVRAGWSEKQIVQHQGVLGLQVVTGVPEPAALTDGSEDDGSGS